MKSVRLKRKFSGQSTVEYALLLFTVVAMAIVVFRTLRPILMSSSDAFGKKIQNQFGKGVYEFKVR